MYAGEFLGEHYNEGFAAKQFMASQRDMFGKSKPKHEYYSADCDLEYRQHQHPALHVPRGVPACGQPVYQPQIAMEQSYANGQAQEYHPQDYYVRQHQQPQQYPYVKQQHDNCGYYEDQPASVSLPASRRPSAMHVSSFASLKRKASEDVLSIDSAPPSKRVYTPHVQVHNGGMYDTSGQNSPYSQYATTPISSSSFHQAGLVPTTRLGHQYSTSNASQISLAAPSPHTPAWSPDFATVKTEPSPQDPVTPVARPASSSPVKSSVPRLVRTSTIQQPSPVGPTFNQTYINSFNPYAIPNLKACLNLKGDLNTMTENWTEEEKQDRRRLVVFSRNQDNSIIDAEFSGVKPEDRAPNSITISCIYWKEKKEYYVTSVDTIFLLEALVGVRFTVEEKNRIRRNLEGYRPATVSKAKLDSEDFFKVIMGFPHPKPRNIEKDVKVFPWKILGEALKKIMSKYSASYSSTASTIMNTVPSNYGADMADFGYPPSPPASYSQYAHEQAAYPSHMIPGRMSAPVTTVPFQLQVQLPTSGPPDMMQEASFNHGMPGMPQASMLMSSDALSAPLHAPAHGWDYEQYANHTPVTAPPHTAPPGVWNRPFETADFTIPMSYQQ